MYEIFPDFPRGAGGGCGLKRSKNRSNRSYKSYGTYWMKSRNHPRHEKGTARRAPYSITIPNPHIINYPLSTIHYSVTRICSWWKPPDSRRSHEVTSRGTPEKSEMITMDWPGRAKSISCFEGMAVELMCEW